MSQYQRLLLIIDPALRHSPAINRAAALAKASGATLHIAALIKPVETLLLLEKNIQEKVRESYFKDHSEWLKDEATRMRVRGIDVTTEVTWADDTEYEILQHVTKIQPDLLIKDVQHEPAIKRAFITPMDWYLLRECPVPVYLVGATGHTLPHNIVAAVDPSRPELQESGLNDRIIQEANSLALQCDAELHLLHAYDVSSVYLGDAGGGGLALTNLTKELRNVLEKSFLTLADHYGVPPDRRHFILGQPVSVLAEFASQHQVDVIVMGRIHRHGLEKLIGSTTEHILYQTSCSILAV
ncbi:universal stress protein [Pseudomonas sp. MH9.2]|uniref:universal stress protein n=1 Tax=unclassified Pseudomonas TaxID=196821 RepID=UPI002AC9ED4E|nr:MULTISPECIES: universal stress protein [unclassified Pseudomonas]MEB0008499.1 universal stress protein [Pseudomonas sp. RTB2]MEB0017022.1 universal stress protein [Pseudomonas sp. RTB3]MEB0028282.1 universal stress protein [Pseudomonas sp. MH9.2]MEB0147419.1 universal stress protein [Pseudomonas sp. CCC2.2]MEB0270985.1 universal stress protein [Pseudomonas sp. 5B4]